MLGMTVGAVWVYLHGERFGPSGWRRLLSDQRAAHARSAMPASLLIQLSLITSLSLSAVVVVAWALLLAADDPALRVRGVAVSVALTRSPVPVNQVYAVDLLGAALGCVAVVVALDCDRRALDDRTRRCGRGAAAAWASRARAARERRRLWYRRPGYRRSGRSRSWRR